MSRPRATLALLAGLCAVSAATLAPAPAARPQQAAPTKSSDYLDAYPAATTAFRRFALRESLRRETLTTHSEAGFSRTTESQSVVKGKTTLEFDLPRESVGDVSAATELSVQVGSGVRWVGKLGDDPKFAPGAREVKIDLFWPGQNAGSRVRRGTTTLKWEKDVVRVKFEREAGANSLSGTAAAETAINSVSGRGEKVDGEVAAWVRLGGAIAKANVPFRASVGRRTAGNDSAFGEVVTADVRGEFKP